MSPSSSHLQDEVHSLSLSDPEKFWSHHASHIDWHKPPSQSLLKTAKTLPKSNVTHPHWSWFPDGEISTTYNCVDRHVKAGNGDNVAIIWDSPVTGSKEKYTYAKVLDEVEVLAGVLREEGVRKGDVVLIYMPMIPSALFAALAITRLGAIHCAVFGGFAATSLAQRIEASQPKVIMTASCGIEGAKGPQDYRPLVEGAIQQSSFKPSKTIIWQRDQIRWKPMLKTEGQRNWQRLVKSARNRNVRAECVPVKSTDGLYVIHTSGTTGLPKGVLREAGGHAVGLNFTVKYIFGVSGPGDVMFCASDIGWVVGHCYILYGPLLAGATTVLYEGKPVGTPDSGAFWRVIEEHKATSLFTAPTALRAIRKDDPEGKRFEDVGRRGGLKQLRALFLAGERSEPSIVQVYQDLLAKHAAQGAMVIDNWWSSESGSPITALALRSAVGFDHAASQGETNPPPPAIRPGSAGKPMPGYDVRIVDDEGNEVSEPGKMGNIVMAMPMSPTSFTTLFNDEERYYKGYLKRFGGKWVDTGDSGMIDQDGYVHIMSRSDDIINVAAHRFSTGSIEQSLLTHPSIAEACVIGIPDPIKGHLPFAFLHLTQPTASSSEPLTNKALPATPPPTLFSELNSLLRTQIGPIATLGGAVQGVGMIPKTRSGKTLRRVLRELVENAVEGGLGAEGVEKKVNVPATVEDGEVVEVARGRVREYFREREKGVGKAKL